MWGLLAGWLALMTGVISNPSCAVPFLIAALEIRQPILRGMTFCNKVNDALSFYQVLGKMTALLNKSLKFTATSTHTHTHIHTQHFYHKLSINWLKCHLN